MKKRYTFASLDDTPVGSSHASLSASEPDSPGLNLTKLQKIQKEKASSAKASSKQNIRAVPLSGPALQESLKKKNERKRKEINYKDPSSEIDIIEAQQFRASQKSARGSSQGSSKLGQDKSSQSSRKSEEFDSQGRKVFKKQKTPTESRKAKGSRQVKQSSNEESCEEPTPRPKKGIKKRSESQEMVFDVPSKLSNFDGPITEFTVSDSELDAEDPILITSGTISSNEVVHSSQDLWIKCPVDTYCTEMVPLETQWPAPLKDRYESFTKTKKLFSKGKIRKDQLNTAKERFCNFHRSLSVFDEGTRQDYPTTIQFDRIPKRLKRFKSGLDKIIDGSLKSTFRKKILASYEELGQWRSQNIHNLMYQMEQAQFGYYGIRGSHKVYGALCEMYPTSTQLTERMKPIPRSDFLQFVLTPEACKCLIAEDFRLDLENKDDATDVSRILEDSCEFGKLVHDEVENEIMVGGHVF